MMMMINDDDMMMTRTLAPQLAVSSGKMTVAPDLPTLAKFFSFFEFE